MRGIAVAVLAGLLLAGCGTNAKLTGAVTGFSEVTSGAVKAQKLQLETFTADRTDRIRTELAADGAILSYSDGCRILVETLEGAEDCFVVGRSGGRVVTSYEAAHILALGAALDAYAQQLVRLAADNSAEAETFSGLLTSLANSVAALNGAAAAVSQSKPVVEKAQLTAIAEVVATVGNLYFQHQRVTALRKIIIASHPVVADAISTLIEADEGLYGYDLSVALTEVTIAKGDLGSVIAAKAEPGKIKEKQQAFLGKFEQFKSRAAAQSMFSKLRQSHEDLANAAASGASAEDMLAYMNSLTDAAATVAQSLETLRS